MASPPLLAGVTPSRNQKVILKGSFDLLTRTDYHIYHTTVKLKSKRAAPQRSRRRERDCLSA